MSLQQNISRKILYGWLGFKEEVTVELPPKYIIALAPHTSNWDFVIGNLYSRAVGIRCKFLMKKEWFFFPLGYFMRRLGGIPVYRNKRMHSTDVIAEQAMSSKEFRLCITPEGTRKANAEWKKGFYYIALKAELPILLYGLDFNERRIVCTKVVIPNGNVDAQMQEIKEYFRHFTGKHPEKFAL